MRTLRGRLFATLAAAAVGAAVLTVALAAFLVRAQVERQALRALERRARAAAAVASADPAALARLRAFLARQGDVLLGPDATGPGALLREAALAAGDGSGALEVAGRRFLFAVAASDAGPYVLARRARSLPADARPLVLAVALAGLVGAGLAGALAYPLARRLSRPIGRLAEATAAVAEGRSGVRVEVEGEDELAALARSFNRMAADLEAAREAERSFLLSVSHELRTPLTAIGGYAEALRDGAVEPSSAGEVIGREAERLRRLVEDLLDLARLGRPGFSVRAEPVDLAAAAREVEGRYRTQAEGFGVALSTVTAAGARAVADHDRVVQVLSNLVENALRVTPAGGRVAIEVGPGLLRVRDTGPGLAPQDLPRAFDRFYLHDRYRGERPVGSGLGLAIVRELARAMGGDVVAADDPGGGAVFEVRLPEA